MRRNLCVSFSSNESNFHWTWTWKRQL